ncbi:hypothetical protein HMI56_002246 [Coelomomyces lativittatus]|nr:hypothetical protein HMI56_002246 [Coelomomyces lativittatus]
MWNLLPALDLSTSTDAVLEHPQFRIIWEKFESFPEEFWAAYRSLPRHRTPFASLEFNTSAIETLNAIGEPFHEKKDRRKELLLYFLKYRFTEPATSDMSRVKKRLLFNCIQLTVLYYSHSEISEIFRWAFYVLRLEVVASSLRSRGTQLILSPSLYAIDRQLEIVEQSRRVMELEQDFQAEEEAKKGKEEDSYAKTLKEYEFSDEEPRYSHTSPLNVVDSPLPISSDTFGSSNDKYSSDTSGENRIIPKTPRKRSHRVVTEGPTLTTQYLIYYNQLNSTKKKEVRSRLGLIVSRKS